MNHLAITLLASSLLATPALAGTMTFDNDFRTQLYDISAETNNFPPDFPSDGTGSPVFAPVPFGDWNYNNSFMIPGYSIDASHTSSITSTELSAQGSISGFVSSEISNYNLAVSAGVGFNDFTIWFSIAETTDFRIEAALSAFGDSGSSSVEIRRATSPFSVLFSESARNEDLTIDELVTLDAGSYSFSLRSDVFMSDALGADNASYNGSLSIVPAPSALGLLSVCGILAARRRR